MNIILALMRDSFGQRWNPSAADLPGPSIRFLKLDSALTGRLNHEEKGSFAKPRGYDLSAPKDPPLDRIGTIPS